MACSVKLSMPHNKITFTCVTAFLVCNIAVASAQNERGHIVNLPDYQTGETFIFSNKRIEHIEKTDGELITFSTRKGRHYIRRRNIVLPVIEWQLAGKTGHRTIHGNTDKLWPLRIGNSIRFRVLTNIHDNEKQHTVRRVGLWSCHVTAWENIRVIAGEFSSYRIVCDRYSEQSMRILQRYTWHYSPAVGHYVRREVNNFLTGKSHHFELVATLPPGKSNTRRITALENTPDQH